MQKLLGEMKNMELICEPVVVRSSVKPEQGEQLIRLADIVADSVLEQNKGNK